jgi:hypothetical protein
MAMPPMAIQTCALPERYHFDGVEPAADSPLQNDPAQQTTFNLRLAALLVLDIHHDATGQDSSDDLHAYLTGIGFPDPVAGYAADRL